MAEGASKDGTVRRSFDSEDEMDSELAGELQAVADPERLKKLAQHFELAWKINRGFVKCGRCRGTGFRAAWLPSDLLP
ncbi:hypothetical protein TSOC_009157 [Tetrabaena socialis]|uniref:Uncharacterized protein n=1 Tax=Tetrabaena socialis TaxID=47790 RepID=A0A2J7ZWP4_9CHLO|nr:hypothetical protein TSOC_009157 [Tetrabaena socialis]|eukprot:PNH04665.1 hypothetical protein TSOC_009157 [Tetrabaena socialis]